MAPGIQPNLGQLNQQSGQLLVNLRNSIQQAQAFYDYLSGLGVSGLVVLGMSNPDATALLAVYTNLAALSAVFYGQAYAGPALPFNFYQQLVPLTGGQAT
jgi:hypothetical protein